MASILYADMSLSRVSLDDGGFEYSSFGLGGVSSPRSAMHLLGAVLGHVARHRALLQAMRRPRTWPRWKLKAFDLARRLPEAQKGYCRGVPRRPPAAAGRSDLVDAFGWTRSAPIRPLRPDPLLPEPRDDEHLRPGPVAHRPGRLARNYVAKLLRGLHGARCAPAPARDRRAPPDTSGAEVRDVSRQGASERFDQVVIASHGDAALAPCSTIRRRRSSRILACLPIQPQPDRSAHRCQC